MWLLKGILVGISIFVVGLTTYLAVFVWRKPSRYAQTGDRGREIAFDSYTFLRYAVLQSPLFLAAFVGALLIGCSLVAYQPLTRLRFYPTTQIVSPLPRRTSSSAGSSSISSRSHVSDFLPMTSVSHF